MSLFTKEFVRHSDRYFKTKWRAPKPTHRDVLNRATEAGHFSGCERREVDERATSLLGRPTKLDRTGLSPKDWAWIVDYGKKETP